MTNINSDQIRDIAVRATEMFINEKVPLSEGIAKQASAMELNLEQIQRSIEATNSIAFLKIQEISGDRTVEFPLAKMAEVMADISVPDILKVASASVSKINTSTKEPLCKEASYTPTELQRGEQVAYFTKMASINERDLSSLKDRAITIVPELIKAAAVINKDPRGLEKLAAVVEGKEFTILSTLVYNEPKKYDNSGFFKEADLKDVYKVRDLYKEAEQVNSDIKTVEQLHDRTKMTKQAIFGLLGKAVGSTISAPFKAVGTLAGNSIANSANAAGVAASKAGIGHVAPVAKKIGLGTVAGKMVTPALDVAVYSPGIDKTTGSSRDVWTALQRQ